MAAMFEVIPAIDLMDGKCVRLEQGRYTQRTVYGDPVDAARAFAGSGVRRLHVVDLDGARAGRPANLAVLEAIAAATELVIDFGGGINSEDDAAAAFSGGADILNIGSMAVRSPETFRSVLGRYREKVLLGADVRGTRLAISGWQEQTEVEVIPFLQGYAAMGGTAAFVTDISRDGMMAGPSLELYRRILAAVPGVGLTASGGVNTAADVLALRDAGCSGVIIGKAFYEGRIDPATLVRDLGQLADKETVCLRKE